MKPKFYAPDCNVQSHPYELFGLKFALNIIRDIVKYILLDDLFLVR